MAGGRGSISLELRAETAGLEGGVKRVVDALGRLDVTAAAKLANFDRRFAVVSAGLSRARAAISGFGIATTLSAAGIGAAVAKTFAFAETLSDTAQFTGVAVESLQELQFAATQNGATVENLTDALKTMTNAVGEFRQGGGPAVDAITQLGLASEILSGELSGGEELFSAFVTQLGKIEDPADRGALAIKVFGEEAGSRLRAMLDLGSEGIEKMRGRARDLGRVMKGELVANAARVNAKMRELGETITYRVMEAITKSAPEIERMVDGLIGALPQIIAFLDMIPKVIDHISSAWAATEGLRKAGWAIGETLYDAGSSVVQFMDDTNQNRAIEVKRYEVEQAVAALDDLKAELDELDKRQAELAEKWFKTSGDRSELDAVSTALVNRAAQLRSRERELARLRIELAELVRGETSDEHGGTQTEHVLPEGILNGEPVVAVPSVDRPLALRRSGVAGDAGGSVVDAAKERAQAIEKILEQLSDDSAGLTRQAVALIGQGGEVEAAIIERQASLRSQIEDVIAGSVVDESKRAPLIEQILAEPDMQSAIEQYAAASRRVAALEAAQELLAQSTVALVDPYEALQDKIARINSLRAQLVEITGSEAKAQQVIAGAVRDASEAYYAQADNLGVVHQSFGVISEGVAGIGSEIFAALQQGESAASRLEAVFGRIALRIAEIAIEENITKPFTSFLQTLASSAFGSLFGNAGAGSFNGVTGSTGFQPVASYGGTPSLGFSAARFSTGGPVLGPGTGTSDSIPAMLSNGEYVIRASSAARYRPLLEMINAGRVPGFASGGAVGMPDRLGALPVPSLGRALAGGSSSSSSAPVSVTINNTFAPGQDHESIRRGTIAAQRDMRRTLSALDRKR